MKIGIFDRLVHCYVSFLRRYPGVILLVSGFVALLLTNIGIGRILYRAINYHESPMSLNPKLGFEARGTKWSGRILAWNTLKAEIARRPSKEKLYSRRGRSMSEQKENINEALAKSPTWVNLFLQAMTASPCSQLNSEVPKMEFLVQAMFKVNSLNDLFTLKTMTALCDFETSMSRSVANFTNVSPYRHMWSFANYAVCIADVNEAPLNCTYLTQQHVDTLRESLSFCVKFQQKMLNCRNKIHTDCIAIPVNCSKLQQDIFYRMISKGAFDDWTEAVYINTFLPMYTWEAYRENYELLQSFGRKAPPISQYTSMFDAVQEFADTSDVIELKGLSFGVKLYVFNQHLGADIKYGVLALLIVTVCILIYSRSLLYTLMVACCLLFSIGAAYTVYTLVFGINFFPFMNLLVFVLMVGIGADDTFILNYIFQQAKRHSVDRRLKTADTLEMAFGHAALAMFVTSATTAAAFYANIVSNVVVIKCFGVFAGTTMLINYFLVITWLPASLLFIDYYIEPTWRRLIKFFHLNRLTCCNPLSDVSSYFIGVFLPKVVNKLKLVFVLAFSALMCSSGYFGFYRPGLHLPATNPLQVFKASHPYEWYDNNAERLFQFAGDRFEFDMFVTVVWGFRPVDDANLYDANGQGTLHRDHSFKMDYLDTLVTLSEICHNLTHSDIIVHNAAPHTCWTDKFMQWSAKMPCNSARKHTCCNVASPYFNASHLPKCMSWGSRKIQNQWVANHFDYPVFLKDGRTLVGYIIKLETRYRYSGIFDKLDVFHKDIEHRLDVAKAAKNDKNLAGGWVISYYTLTTRWYDLLLSLQHLTPISIAVSVLVALLVVVLTTWTLVVGGLAVLTIAGVIASTVASMVWMHWPINVVESTILILTVGLSFDFTLHYAVAYKLAPPGCADRIGHSFRQVGAPVLLSAATTFGAGAAMLPSTTNAFYEIGAFMCLVTLFSWLYASFFFTSLLALLGPLLDRRQPPTDAEQCSEAAATDDTTEDGDAVIEHPEEGNVTLRL